MAIAKIRIETESEEISASDNGKQLSKEEKARLAFQTMMAQKVLQLGKQAMSESIGMIGVTTGDYTTQKNIEAFAGLLTNVATTAVSFYVNPYLGAVKLAGDVIKETFSITKRIKQEKRQQMAEQVLAKRTGNSLTNGSRTGN